MSLSRQLILSLYLVIALVSAQSCSKKATSYTSSNTSALADVDFNKLLNEKSTITINYTISNKAIQDTFAYFVDSIYGLDWKLDYDAEIFLKRNGPVKVELTGKDMLVTLPTSIKVTKSTFLGNLTANGAVSMQFVAKLDIDTLWTMKVKTQLIDYTWVEKPKLNAGIVNLPVETIANKVFDQVKPMIEQGIDQGINESFNLRAMIMDVTKQFSTPYQLHQIYGGWLYMVPDSTYLTGIVNKQGVSMGKIAITAKTIISSTKPDLTIFPKVPKVKWVNRLSDSSALNLQMDLAYAYLDSLAYESVVGQTFEEEGKSITVTKVKVGPLGTKLSLTLGVKGSFNGEIVVLGSPYYDKNTRTIKSRDIDINVRTGNVLHKAAAFLLKGKMKSELSKAMEFPIGEKIKQAQVEVDKSVDSYYKPYQMQVQVRLGEPDLPVFFPRADRLSSTISMKLYLSALFRDLSFFRG